MPAKIIITKLFTVSEIAPVIFNYLNCFKKPEYYEMSLDYHSGGSELSKI